MVLRLSSRFGRLLAAVGLAVGTTAGVATDSSDAEAASPENTLVITVETEAAGKGDVIIEMFPDSAPKHVARIKELARSGFYDGVVFHRVIDGFMAQTGDPEGTGMGGSGQKLPAEFNSRRHLRGTVSMARTNDPNSADSQFFICFAPAPFLDGEYTVWGQVIAGMDHVDAIKKGSKSQGGAVRNPDRMLTVRVQADMR